MTWMRPATQARPKSTAQLPAIIFLGVRWP
jgi:hypothetical protein